MEGASRAGLSSKVAEGGGASSWPDSFRVNFWKNDMVSYSWGA